MKSRQLLPPLLGLLVSSASGAVLSRNGTVGTAVSSADLTAAGTTNWAAWNRSNSTVASAAPNYRMAGGTGTISNATTTNPAAITGPPNYAATVRGTESLASYPDNVFSWSNAVGDVAPPAQMAGVFHSTLDQTVHGVMFTLTDLPALADGQFYRINIYGSSFAGTGTLSLTLGDLTATMSTNPHGVGDDSKVTDLFAFDYNPDDEDAELVIAMTLTTDTGNSAHGLIQGIAISAIPEPSLSLLSLAGCVFLFQRRRP
jgi:hypothetical protein